MSENIVEVGGRFYRITPFGAKTCLKLSAATAHLINGPLRGIIANAGVFVHLEKYDKGEKIVMREVVDSLNGAELLDALSILADYVLDCGEDYVSQMLDHVWLLENEAGTGTELPCRGDGWDHVFTDHFVDMFEVLYEVGQRNFTSSGNGPSEIKSKASQALKKAGSSLKPKSSPRRNPSQKKS